MRRMLLIGFILNLGLFSPGLDAWASEVPTPSTGSDAAASRQVRIAADQGPLEAVVFYVLAGAIVFSCFGIVLSGSVVRMAMWLLGAFGAVAMLFFLLQAYFLGVVQLIVYAGGILVLIVFGIMLTSSSPWARFEIGRGELFFGGLVCLLLGGSLAGLLYRTAWASNPQSESITMHDLGRQLLGQYLVPFEVVGVLLLAVMIGAAYLARQPRRG